RVRKSSFAILFVSSIAGGKNILARFYMSREKACQRTNFPQVVACHVTERRQHSENIFSRALIRISPAELAQAAIHMLIFARISLWPRVDHGTACPFPVSHSAFWRFRHR